MSSSCLTHTPLENWPSVQHTIRCEDSQRDTPTPFRFMTLDMMTKHNAPLLPPSKWEQRDVPKVWYWFPSHLRELGGDCSVWSGGVLWKAPRAAEWALAHCLFQGSEGGGKPRTRLWFPALIGDSGWQICWKVSAEMMAVSTGCMGSVLGMWCHFPPARIQHCINLGNLLHPCMHLCIHPYIHPSSILSSSHSSWGGLQGELSLIKFGKARNNLSFLFWTKKSTCIYSKHNYSYTHVFCIVLL